MLQKEQKVVAPPGMVKKYLIDLGILEEYHKSQEEKDRERIQGKRRWLLFIFFNHKYRFQVFTGKIFESSKINSPLLMELNCINKTAQKLYAWEFLENTGKIFIKVSTV